MIKKGIQAEVEVSSPPSRLPRITQRIGNSMRFVVGAALATPDGFWYPHDVREKASDILGIVPTLGRVSTATVAQRTSIINTYTPGQVTSLVRGSERMHWVAKPGFYGTLAKRVVRESGNMVPTNVPSRPPISSRTSTKKRRIRHSKPKLTIVKNKD